MLWGGPTNSWRNLGEPSTIEAILNNLADLSSSFPRIDAP